MKMWKTIICSALVLNMTTMIYAQKTWRAPAGSELATKIRRFAPTTLTDNISRLTPNDQKALIKIMAVVHPKPFAARIADLSSGRAGEAVANLTDIAPSPGIWLPLGAPDLVRAQIRALVRAKESLGYPDNVILMVGGINSAAEAAALRVLCVQAGGESLKLGLASRSPHCLLALPEIAKHADMVWIDYRALSAACYHYPDDLVLSRGVMKSYIEDGYMPLNPANQVDDVIEKLLPSILGIGHSCQFGVTFAGWTVSEDVVRFFTQRGFRNFGVESSELAATRLLLGRLASSTNRSEGD